MHQSCNYSEYSGLFSVDMCIFYTILFIHLSIFYPVHVKPIECLLSVKKAHNHGKKDYIFWFALKLRFALKAFSGIEKNSDVFT